jgi:hypothetical protein
MSASQNGRAGTRRPFDLDPDEQTHAADLCDVRRVEIAEPIHQVLSEVP